MFERLEKTEKIDASKPTVERLLDAAEVLFAESGFDAVGMRALADAAGVNLGAATYHFGSKEALYTEVFLRRFRPTEARRLELLKEAEAKTKEPLPVKTIVECLIRPPFFTILEHPSFAKLMARNLFLPPPFIMAVLAEELEKTRVGFLAAFARSLPKLPEELVVIRMMLSGGVLLMFAANMEQIGSKLPVPAREMILSQLVEFTAAGMQAPAGKMPPFPFPKPPFAFFKKNPAASEST